MRESTKVYVGGSKTTIVGGDLIEYTGGKNIVWAKKITITAGGKIIQTGKEGGVVYGDYVPPDEVYTTHPKVEKVEFVDENEKILDQNTKDFYYGQKLKIRVTTTNANGNAIIVSLQAKSKSKNQKFDMLNTKHFTWGFHIVENELYETPLFVLTPNWYSDDFETYNDSTHQTEIKEEDLNEFFAEIILDAQRVYLPLEGERLKPITYKRNYEELIGLFKTKNEENKDNTNNADKTGNTIDKDLLENYENLYIDKYADENEDIKDIVDNFSEWLCEDNPEASIEQIKTKVAESAKKLWENAVWQHKDHSMKITTTDKKTGEKKEEKTERKANLDDRPLYWARIAMQVILKRQYVFIKDIKTLKQDEQNDFFNKSIVPKSSRLWEIIQIFEEKSRNYDGIDFKAAGGKPKVLITGFDPFVLNPNNGGNILQSNPSGIVALALANNTELGAYIQTMVVPVRFADFDGRNESVPNSDGSGFGIIEKYIGKIIDDVDMIITISQAGENEYHIDKYATATRDDSSDNMNFVRQYYSRSVPDVVNTKDEWLETTLPPTLLSAEDNVIYFYHRYKTSPNSDWFYSNEKPPVPAQQFIKDKGDNYLSNEIFYRVSKLRNASKRGASLPTGHFHITPIMSGNLDSTKAQKMLEIVSRAINRACVNLK